jgi:hypothetical protein
MFLIFVPFAWQATVTVISKLKIAAVEVQKTPSQPPPTAAQPPKTDLPPKAPPVDQKPTDVGAVKSPKKRTAPKSTDQGATATNVPSSNPPPSQYEQKCEGSACAQGPGSTATYNQYGARELKLSSPQGDSIASAMGKFSGMKIYINCEAQTPDIEPFTQEILRALGKDGAGMDVSFSPPCAGMLMGPQNEIPYPGISMAVGPECSSMANALADELDKVKILDKRMPIQVMPDMRNLCSLTVRPNR